MHVRVSGVRIITWICRSWSHARSAGNHGCRIMPALIVEHIADARSFSQSQKKISNDERQESFPASCLYKSDLS
jgi:hypothetical protein